MKGGCLSWLHPGPVTSTLVPGAKAEKGHSTVSHAPPPWLVGIWGVISAMGMTAWSHGRFASDQRCTTAYCSPLSTSHSFLVRWNLAFGQDSAEAFTSTKRGSVQSVASWDFRS